MDVHGPFAPDTVFMRARKTAAKPGEFDVVLAMYHDQGLIPVKYLGVEKGVNVTLGLPLVRTSPDHGTAFDIAGQGVAIGWRHLVDNLLEQNWLCRPVSDTVISRFGYYVVQPQRKRRGQLVQRFVEWLLAEQASSAQSLTGLALPSIAV